MIGNCRLCLAKGVDLQASHIVPKWAYKRARGRGANADPVVFRRGKVLWSSRQDTEFLLCKPCELRFALVEDRIARVVYQADGTAPLLDQIGPVVEAGASRTRAALPGRLVLDDIIYFAASVIWRGAVSTVIHNCALTEEQSEALRLFLTGEAEFPMNAAILVVFYDLPLDNGSNAFNSLCTTPSTERLEGCQEHEFVVFGLRPRIIFGDPIPEWLQMLCLHRSAQKLVILAPQQELMNWLSEGMSASKPIGGYARELSRRPKPGQ